MNRLNEIEARANAATEGPWMGIRYPDGFLGRVIGGNGFGVAEDFPDDADAEFIAHSRTDVPDMTAALPGGAGPPCPGLHLPGLPQVRRVLRPRQHRDPKVRRPLALHDRRNHPSAHWR